MVNGIRNVDPQLRKSVEEAIAATGYVPNHAARSLVTKRTGSIALIEAEHAGYINTLLNKVHTLDVFGNEQQFAQPLTVQQVVNLAGPFIQDLNGGPALTFNATPSRNNDIAILNFALALVIFFGSRLELIASG